MLKINSPQSNTITGEGAQWNNFYQPGTTDDNFSLLDAMIMLLVDTVLYMLVAWYVDNVNPGEAGVAQPFWFPFMVCFMDTVKIPSKYFRFSFGKIINLKKCLEY